VVQGLEQSVRQGTREAFTAREVVRHCAANTWDPSQMSRRLALFVAKHEFGDVVISALPEKMR
jgi:hypothetical protein